MCASFRQDSISQNARSRVQCDPKIFATGQDCRSELLFSEPLQCSNRRSAKSTFTILEPPCLPAGRHLPSSVSSAPPPRSIISLPRFQIASVLGDLRTPGSADHSSPRWLTPKGSNTFNQGRSPWTINHRTTPHPEGVQYTDDITPLQGFEERALRLHKA